MNEGMVTDFDVAVIGGGPAGSTAAYHLSQSGMKVILFEKNSLPRYKTCGGGIVFRVNSILPFEFNEIPRINCYYTNLTDHRAKLKFSAQRNKPIITMVMRSEFDYYLLLKAKSSGARIIENSSVKNINQFNGDVHIETGENKFSVKYVIAADGASGIASRLTGNNNNRNNLPAIEAEVFPDEKSFEKYKISARFDFDIIPKGYGWVFPKKDHLSIGVVRMKKGKTNLNKILDKYLDVLEIHKINNIEKHGFYIPMLKGNSVVLTKDRILFTGDAAALADPVTGEGISSAVLSGKIAAESIMGNYENSALVMQTYTDKIKKLIIREHNYAKIISALVYSYPRIRVFLFKNYGQKLVELMTDIITGKKQYSQMLTSPANYFKLVKYLFIRSR